MSTTAVAEPVTELLEPRPSSHRLWQRYHHHGGQEENALVEQYLPLVRSVLGRLAMTLPEHVDQEDLNSVGLMGLLQALRQYDPVCGTSFQTYARLRIRGAMLDELRRMDWVPRSVHEKARALQSALSQLEQQLGRTPTEAEISEALNLSPDQYRELLDEVRPATFVCLDAAASGEEDDGACLGEIVADPAEDGPVEKASRNDLKKIILGRLTELPANQRRVLALYYAEDLHLKEIAEVLGVTESRVCQIHSQAILSIRAYLRRLEGEPSQPTARSQIS